MTYPVPFFTANGSVALVAGSATLNLLVSPGAQQAYRVVGLQLMVGRTVAAAIVDIAVQNTGATITVARGNGLSLAGTSIVTFMFPEPGYQLPKANGIDVIFGSTAATGTGFAVVYYYIDAFN